MKIKFQQGTIIDKIRHRTDLQGDIFHQLFTRFTWLRQNLKEMIEMFQVLSIITHNSLLKNAMRLLILRVK